MKRQIYDYSGFSLRRLNEPRFCHLKLLGSWLVYFALYFLTENLIPAERCHIIECALDAQIPFCEYFVIVYAGWYLFVAGALAYTLFYHVEAFRQLQKFILITQLLAMVCYIVYPSIQDLRPTEFPRENIFTGILSAIYAFDTPKGVFPSLHVVFSIGITAAALKDRLLPKGWKAAAIVFTMFVCFAVCFVKQHSCLDVLAALPLSLIALLLVYGPEYRKARKPGNLETDRRQ